MGKSCIDCDYNFELTDAIKFAMQPYDNRIYCPECQSKQFVVTPLNNASYIVARFGLGWLWLLGAFLGYLLVELQLKGALYDVIGVVHFVMMFFGAVLGATIGRYGKELLKFICGEVSAQDG